MLLAKCVRIVPCTYVEEYPVNVPDCHPNKMYTHSHGLQLQEEESAKKGKDEDVDLLNLAPQKIDWDLKRDIAPKLEKLERRTQRAIAEIINERLASEKST
eukprot:m.101466 g.101466  ORF g.101466 m.101466 type:complete len:101 (+) comp10392_c0_seq2:388-690(+)